MNRFLLMLTVVSTFFIIVPHASADDQLDRLVASALDRSGKNREQLEAALKGVAKDNREGMRFLIAHMPERDLKSLTSRFLIDNVEMAYQAWQKSPWKKQVPKAIFLNNVLPYANVSESRDNWRADFRKRFGPIVASAKTPTEAATLLNRKIFPLLKVRYSRKRRRADQGPFESMKTGTASCTGLSVLLIDACRSVGVPARFVGTPLWSDKSGNHSWVEIWDNGWHFTGAAEPSGDALNRAWFIGRASKAQVDHKLHAIYAVSYKRTPVVFPMVWDRESTVYAVNVTNRYTRRQKTLPDGFVEVQFRAFMGEGKDRQPARIHITDGMGKTVFKGKSHDEGFDGNDHLIVPLRKDATYTVNAEYRGKRLSQRLKSFTAGQLITLRLK